MEYKGRKIKSIEISENDKVIASISDEKLETTNGYIINVIPHISSVKIDTTEKI